MTVPVALEEFVDGLDTETKEEDDNLELAKGDGVHENQLPEVKQICIFLILQHTSQDGSRKKLIWRKTPSTLLAGHPLTI